MTGRPVRWGIAAAALLAVLAAGSREPAPWRVSAAAVDATNIAGDETSADGRMARPDAAPMAAARILPTFRVGDLPIMQAKANPVQPPMEQVKPAEEPARTADAPARPRKEGASSDPLEGARPSLEIAYDGIGLDRFLSISETVGRFFTLRHDGSGIALGPAVSFRTGRSSHVTTDAKALLARRQSYLVSDAAFTDRLGGLALPPNTVRDRLLLLWDERFDAKVWRAVNGALASRNLVIDDVSAVRGGYVGLPGRTVIELRAALIRSGGAFALTGMVEVTP